jgi:hypothetical protein
VIVSCQSGVIFSRRLQGFWYQVKLDVSQTRFQPNPACGAVQFTYKLNSSGLPFLQDFASQQTVGKVGPQYPNWTPFSALNAAVTPTSTPGLSTVLFQFPFGNISSPYSVLAVTSPPQPQPLPGLYDSFISSNGPAFSAIFFNVRTPTASPAQLDYFQQFVSRNSFWQTILDVPQPSNCYYAQKATPPGVPVPVEALYSGPDNILQWYHVLSGFIPPAGPPLACTALTMARQTTDAALKPLTPWVLGKVTTNNSAGGPVAYNISVDSIDNSTLVFFFSYRGTSVTSKMRLVNVDTSIPGVTTLILTSVEFWYEVWMLSTSSSQLPQAYVDIWNNFRANLGAACSNCPKYTFPGIDNVAPVSQGSSCNYPPGVSPSYQAIQLQL